jgi:hypothetical protein
MSNSDAARVWRLIVETAQAADGYWQATLPGVDWSLVGTTEQEARDRAVERAVDTGEDPDEVVRRAPRRIIELEDDEFSDGSWRAWFASGGWVVSGSSEDDAKNKADAEWFRRRDDPDENARRIATMRRHPVEPVAGVRNTPAAARYFAGPWRHGGAGDDPLCVDADMIEKAAAEGNRVCRPPQVRRAVARLSPAGGCARRGRRGHQRPGSAAPGADDRKGSSDVSSLKGRSQSSPARTMSHNP